jgi:iron-sulfur cluster repair protein YtfE (RIC family)
MPRILSFSKSVRDVFGDAFDDFARGMNEIGAQNEAEVVQHVEERFHRVVSEAKAELKTDMADLKAELKTDMADLKAELKTDMADLKAELKTDMADLKAELKTDMAAMKSDIIKWMFAFWIGQMAVVIGLIFALFTFFRQ